MGVWIETDLLDKYILCVESHPSWVCGLKLFCLIKTKGKVSHTLRGCVDWNALISYVLGIIVGSHPSWVCGLKLGINIHLLSNHLSHPSWVCGLKLVDRIIVIFKTGHTLRGCVDWNLEDMDWSDISVAESHPSWVCGLKPEWWCGWRLCWDSHTLRGCVDWNILTACSWASLGGHTLRGCVDWNSPTCVAFFTASASHPSWVCGLKQTGDSSNADVSSHTLRGCVDWTWLPACYTLSK